MAKKDPALVRDSDFDDDFLSELDTLGNDLEGVDVDTQGFDSDKDREPVDKLKSVTADLRHVGKNAMGGAATSISMRLKHEMPEVTKMVGDVLDVASEAKRFKDDTVRDLRPTINQSKLLSRQMLKYGQDLIPAGIYDKLMKALDVPEEDKDKRPSLEETRQIAQEQALAKISKVQMRERMLSRQQEAADRIVSEKVSGSRHVELAGMVNDIRTQALFHTNFLRSAFTAYMRKDLELKYRHMYLAEDTLEALRITSQMMEKRLDAIRHNTSLPDSQKVRILEIMKDNTKNKIIGSVQNTLQEYAAGIFGKIKENYITPAKDMLGTGNDAMEGLLSMLDMNADMGEKFNAKKSLLGHAGGFVGKMFGDTAMKKLVDKLPDDAREVLKNHASMGTHGLMLLMEQLRRGERDFEGSDTLSSILDSILPERDRTGGKFTNDVYNDPNAPGAISKRFTTTVEEIIPGYLAKQVALLQEMVTGKKSEEMVYDFKSRDFVSSSQLNKELFTKIYGTEDERGAVLKGNATVVREALVSKGKRAQATFEEVAKEVSIFMINLSNADRWARLEMEDIKEVANSGDATSEYNEIAFRGISNKQQVATALLSLITNGDGSINEAVKSSIELRISKAAVENSQKHRQAMHDAVFNFGYGRHMKNMIGANQQGELEVNDRTRLAAYDSIGSDKVKADYEYSLDSFGRKIKEKTALEKIIDTAKGSTFIKDKFSSAKGSTFIKDKFSSAKKHADAGLTKLAVKMGKEEEYSQIKTYLNDKFKNLCAFLQQKKQKVRNFSSDIKSKIVAKAYDWLHKNPKYNILTRVIFDKEGKLRDNIPASELADLLARIPGLHSLCQRIHKADGPITFVLDSMLPPSLIMVAKMTEEELSDILQSANPEEQLAARLDKSSKVTKPVKKSRAPSKVFKDDRFKNRIPGKKRKADGGTIDEFGEPVGTISKPTLIANGNALAGEAGKETVVPLNQTHSAKEAYLQAKAYHEGKTFAEGGTPDAEGKKLSTKLGNLIDSNVNKSIKATAKGIRHLDLQDDAANEDLKIVAKRLNKTKVNTTEKLEAAQAKFEKLCEDLSKLDPKSGAIKVVAAITKFVAAVHKDGLWEQLPPSDRVLIQKIKACVKGKDFGLTSIRSISNKTTPIFKKAVKRYQEAYVRAEEYVNETVDKAKELGNDVKLRVTDAVEKAKKSKFVADSKKAITSGVSHVKDFFSGFADSVQPLLKNKHGSLVDIAAEQLAVQHSILDFLGGKVGKYGKAGRYAHTAETGDGTKKPVYENFWHEASDKLGRGIKKVAWDIPVALTEKTVRNTWDTSRGFLTNKSTSVYRKPGAGQTFGKELLLISAEDFSKGVFFDPEGKKRVKSVMDINKPVYDATGKMLISESDLAQGLVDEKQKPLRSVGGRIGRLAHNTTTGALGLAGSAVSKSFDIIKNSHVVSKTFDVAAMPFNIAHATLQKWVDIYRPGQKEPLVTARDLKFGRLRFADGSAIKDAYSINRPVIWIDSEDNGDKRGNLAITWDDIDAGLVTSSGKPLAGVSNQIGSLARRAVGLVGKGANLLFSGTTGILGLGRKIVVGAVKAVFSKTDPYVDVYVPDDKGEIKIGEPALTGGNIKIGRYVYANGQRVSSAYGIDRAVLDAETGKTLITEADIQRGLVDIRRNKLSKFAGKSVAGKVVSGISSLTGWGLKTAWKGIKGLGRGIAKGAKFLTKGIFDKGVDIVSYMHGALNDILGTVFQKDNVRRQDLMEIVGTRLDSIYQILNTRMPGKVAGDSDGDGIRNGSYQDAQKKKEKKATTKAQKGGRAAAALAAAGAAAKGNKEDKDSGGMFDGAADAKAAWDTFKDSKIGKGLGKAGGWMKGKIGAGAKFLGRGAMTAGARGLTALASTGIGTAVSGAASSIMASGSALLASATTGVGAVLGTATSALASGASVAGSAIVGLASNPVGWAIAAGLLLYGGYKLASWAFGESEADKDWRQLRHEYYGTNADKHEEIIDSLEKRTLKTLDKKETGLTKEELEEYAIDFGLVDKGFLGIGGNNAAENKERMDYFATWYSARFSPVFAQYVERIRSATGTEPGDKLKPNDMPKDRAEYAREYFIKRAKLIVDQGNTKSLIPTEEGFKKYKQSEEETKKKDEKPDAATAAKTAAGVGALATPKAAADADKKEAKSKTQEEIDKATAASKNAKPTPGIPGTKDGEKPSFLSVVGDALKWATGMGILASAGYKIFTWMFGDSTEVILWKTLKHQYYGTTEDKHKSALKKLESSVLDIVAGHESEMKPADLEEHAENFGLIDRGIKIGVVIGPRVGGDDNTTIKARMEYFTSWYALRFRPIYQTYLNIIAAYTGSKPGDKPNPDDIPEDKRKQAQDAFRKEGDILLSRNPEVKDLIPSLDGFIDYLKKKQKEEEAKKVKTGDSKTAAPSTSNSSEESILAKIGAATAAKNTTTDSDKEDTAKRKTLADAKLQQDMEASKKLGGHKDIDPRKHSGNAAAVAARGTIFEATPDMKVNASPLQLAVGAAGGAGNYTNQQSGGGGTAPQINPESLKAATIPDGGSGDLGSYMKKFESGDEGTSNISWDSTGGTSYGTYQFAAKKGGLQAFLDWAKKSGGEFGQKLVTAMGAAGKLETGSSKGAAPDVWRQFAKIEGNPLGKLEQNFTYEKVYKVALAGIKDPKAKALIMGDRGLQEALWSTAVGHGIGGAPSLFMKVYKDGMTAEEWISAIYKERPTRYQSSTPRIQASMAKRYAKELPIMLGLSKAKGQAAQGGASGTGGEAGSGTGGGGGGGDMSPNTLATAGAGGLTGTPATDKMQAGFHDAMNNEGGDGKNGWKRPTDSSVITSPFGPRNVPGGSKNHKGIDLRARMGEPIYAAKSGTVVAAGGSYNAIELKHEGGEGSKYLHLSKLNVRAGQQVKEGEVIGQSGGAGPNGPNQYPAHLHFEILKGGKPVDPEPFMKSAGISLNRKGEKGNEGMAPESDANATPKTGNEQSAAGLKEQEAKAGNPDAKTSDTGAGSTTGTDQSQGTDIKQQSADVAKAGIEKTLNTAYGAGGASSAGASADTGGGGTPSGGGAALPSAPAASANTNSDNTGVPQVQTNTPTQTGQIGPDITANAQLEQLKLIVSILSGIREDNKGYFGGGPSKDGAVSETTQSTATPGETAKQTAQSTDNGAVTTAVQQAFAPGSPTLAAIQSAIAGMSSSNNQQSNQNQPIPSGIDRSTMRTPLDTSKKSGSAFQL